MTPPSAAPPGPQRKATVAWLQAYAAVSKEAEGWAVRLAEGQPPLKAGEAARLNSLVTSLKAMKPMSTPQAQITAQAMGYINKAGGQSLQAAIDALPAHVVQTVTDTAAAIGYTAVPNQAAVAQVVNGGVGALTGDFAKMTVQVQADLIDALTLSLVTGESPKVAAKRFQDALGPVFGQGQYRSVMIARTTMARAYDQASLTTYQQAAHEGLIHGWRWVARPGACDVCRTLHGTIFPAQVDTYRHPNCTCVTVPVLMDEPAAKLGYGQRYKPYEDTKVNDLELKTSKNGWSSWTLNKGKKADGVMGPKKLAAKSLNPAEQAAKQTITDKALGVGQPSVQPKVAKAVLNEPPKPTDVPVPKPETKMGDAFIGNWQDKGKPITASTANDFKFWTSGNDVVAEKNGHTWVMDKAEGKWIHVGQNGVTKQVPSNIADNLASAYAKATVQEAPTPTTAIGKTMLNIHDDTSVFQTTFYEANGWRFWRFTDKNGEMSPKFYAESPQGQGYQKSGSTMGQWAEVDSGKFANEYLNQNLDKAVEAMPSRAAGKPDLLGEWDKANPPAPVATELGKSMFEIKTNNGSIVQYGTSPQGSWKFWRFATPDDPSADQWYVEGPKGVAYVKGKGTGGKWVDAENAAVYNDQVLLDDLEKLAFKDQKPLPSATPVKPAALKETQGYNEAMANAGLTTDYGNVAGYDVWIHKANGKTLYVSVEKDGKAYYFETATEKWTDLQTGKNVPFSIQEELTDAVNTVSLKAKPAPAPAPTPIAKPTPAKPTQTIITTNGDAYGTYGKTQYKWSKQNGYWYNYSSGTKANSVVTKALDDDLAYKGLIKGEPQGKPGGTPKTASGSYEGTTVTQVGEKVTGTYKGDTFTWDGDKWIHNPTNTGAGPNSTTALNKAAKEGNVKLPGIERPEWVIDVPKATSATKADTAKGWEAKKLDPSKSPYDDVTDAEWREAWDGAADGKLLPAKITAHGDAKKIVEYITSYTSNYVKGWYNKAEKKPRNDEVEAWFKNAPMYASTTYRGMDMRSKKAAWDYVQNQAQIGQILDTQGGWSHSFDRRVASGRFGGEDRAGSILVEVRGGTSGYPVEGFTRVKREQEIIVWSKLKVLEVHETPRGVHIIAEEVGKFDGR